MVAWSFQGTCKSWILSFVTLQHPQLQNSKPLSEFQFLIKVGNIQQCFNDHCLKGFKVYNLLIAPIKPQKDIQ